MPTLAWKNDRAPIRKVSPRTVSSTNSLPNSRSSRRRFPSLTEATAPASACSRRIAASASPSALASAPEARSRARSDWPLDRLVRTSTASTDPNGPSATICRTRAISAFTRSGTSSQRSTGTNEARSPGSL